jgi:type IV pilus assembly protein PilV
MTTSLSRYHHGFSMVEMLVTVLVLSVGLLGLAGMQINALKSSHSAFLHNQATALSYEIGERIRSNRSEVQQGRYDILFGDQPATAPDCEVANCDAATMADYDLSQWKGALATLLPAGDGAISHLDTLVTIRVFWDERRNDATGTGCDPDNPADMACFDMSFIP